MWTTKERKRKKWVGWSGSGNDECVCLKAKFSLSTGEPQSMMEIQNLKIVEEGLTKDGLFCV